MLRVLREKPCLFAEREQRLLDLLPLGCDRGLAADEDERVMRRELVLMEAVALAEKPLDAHAAHGAAELFAGGEADLAFEILFARAHGEDIEHEVAARVRFSEAIDALEIRRALQHAVTLEREFFHDAAPPAIFFHRPSPPDRLSTWKKATKLGGLNPFLCGNPFPATLASSLQDEAAAFRLHALAEAVRHLAPMVVRLIRLLQIVHLPASGVLQAAVLPARIVSYSRL